MLEAGLRLKLGWSLGLAGSWAGEFRWVGSTAGGWAGQEVGMSWKLGWRMGKAGIWAWLVTVVEAGLV